MKFKAICNDCGIEFKFDDVLMMRHLCSGKEYGPFDSVPIITILEDDSQK